MTALQILGAAIIAAVYLALFIAGARLLGFRETLLIYLGTALLVAIVFLGSALLTGEIA